MISGKVSSVISTESNPFALNVSRLASRALKAQVLGKLIPIIGCCIYVFSLDAC
jgi:DNA-directed RNA polymerase subunit E'/Rpb7